jgi:hypothetical protein
LRFTQTLESSSRCGNMRAVAALTAIDAGNYSRTPVTPPKRQMKLKIGEPGNQAGAPYFFFAGIPVPDSPTTCGEWAALSKIIRLPVCGVSPDGLKVTNALQLLPGASVFLH